MKDSDFANMQKKYYEKESSRMRLTDHVQHQNNPNLYLLGYGPAILNKAEFYGSSALDFACGTGRNMRNLHILNVFERIAGCDISKENILAAEEKLRGTFPNGNFDFFVNDGISVPQNKGKFKFIFSTIALQHIPVRNVRNKIFKDLHDILEEDGLFSFQMAFRLNGTKAKKGSVGYFRNLTGTRTTNGKRDVRIENPKHLIDDLKGVGFNHINYFITESWEDSHSNWIWIHASKQQLNYYTNFFLATK
jgi:SAM-dependent methyltransferase